MRIYAESDHMNYMDEESFYDDESEINSISLTLISDLINSEISIKVFFSSSFLKGTKIFGNGCLTFIFSFFLNDNANEQIS